MGYTVNSIEIDVDIDRVFAITNVPANFVRLMGYKSLQLLERVPLVDGRVVG